MGQKPDSDITIDQWTQALGTMTTRVVNPEQHLEKILAADPGVGVLRHLIGAGRSGTIINALPWTSELLFLMIGGSAYQQILQEF